MALIHCPECGKEVSDQAKTCVGCGYPIQKWLAQQAAQKTAEQREAARAEKVAKIQAKTAALEQFDDPEETETNQRSRKRWFIIGGAALLAIAAIVTILFVFVFQQEDKDVPTLGLKADMSIEKITETMKRHGFTSFETDYESEGIYGYTGKTSVFGREPSVIAMIKIDNHPVKIRYVFIDMDYMDDSLSQNAYTVYSDLESLGKELREKADAKFGKAAKPQTDYDEEYVWTSNRYDCTLQIDQADHWIAFIVTLKE